MTRYQIQSRSQFRALIALVVTLVVIVFFGGCAHIGYMSPEENPSLQVTVNGRPAGAPATINAAGQYQSDREASQRCDVLVQAFLAGQVAFVPFACQALGYGGYGVPYSGTPLLRSAAADTEADEVRRQLVRAVQAIDGQQGVIKGQSQEIRNLEEDLNFFLEE